MATEGYELDVAWGRVTLRARDTAGLFYAAETFRQLPPGSVVERKSALRVKGKADAVQAYVLLAVPA